MKKGLLLTCLLTLIAAFGMAQSQWPITITRADGLPGTKGPLNYTFKTPQYSFEEAFQTLRFTVCSTTRIEPNTTSYDGFSSGWGPGNAFFELGELTVLDANGQPIDYVANTNALNTWDGSSKGTTLALNDGSFGTWFRTTWYKGACPQDYHYIDLEFANPINVFSLEWYTSTNALNEPTYVGLTPGTVYSPYPEQNFELGAKVADVAELAEGGLFVIQDNAPSYHYGLNADGTEGYDRGAPYQNKAFYHSPCGGVLTPGAGTVVFLKPTGEDNVYNVQWLNNGHVIATQSSTGWTAWSDNVADAASILFSNSENSESDGNIRMTSVDGEFTYLADALGKMAFYTNVDTVLAKRSRPFDLNFSIYKANLDLAPVKAVLDAAVADAQARVDLYGYNATEDEGQYEAITSAIAAAKALAADASAADVIAARNAVIDALPAYVALGIYAWTDSAQIIIDALQSGEFEVSAAPNWVEGSYPEGSDAALRQATDDAFIVLENNPTIAQVDAAIASVTAAIDRFWASKITGVKSLPFRVGAKEDGLPGAYQSSTGYIWESPMYLLTEETSTLRFTVFSTNTPDKKFGDWVYFTLGEFELFDLYGNKIELTEESFDANSIDPADGSGFAGLCDGKTDTWFHAVYANSEGHNPKAFEGKVPCYLDITLPEAISGFRYKQTGRVYSGTTRVNTPVDFAFGRGGEDVTPSDVPFDDPYNAQVGEKITDVSQITDDGIYAIQGLISCDPVNHFDDDLREPRFFSGIDVYGKTAQAPCAYSIRKNTDGTYLIQSLADGKYWSKSHDGDGWCGASATQYVEAAANVHIEPMGNAGLPNSFVMYHYEDSLVRDGIVRPYLIFQDWGDNLALFSCETLADNDKDGEGEWYIFKLTMDNAYVYWLKNLVAVAEGLGLEYRPDPGYYKDLGTFPETLAAAQAAVAANDNDACKALVAALDASIAGVKDATPNPMTEGIFMIETGFAGFFNTQGVSKAVCAFANDAADADLDCAAKLYWADKPAMDSYSQGNDIFKFEFISAASSDAVQIMLDDSVITAEQAANAYYIKSIVYNSFVGERDKVSKDIPLVASQDDATVYIVRQQLPTIYDLWNPKGSSFSLHAEDNGNGTGVRGHIVYWTGSSEASYWRLRYLGDRTSINNSVVEEGDEVVSVTYYNAAGVASATPVQGVNIVKTVYANGVVKSEKVVIK